MQLDSAQPTILFPLTETPVAKPSDSVAFVRIEPEMVDGVWDRCKHHLEKSFSPIVKDYTLDDLRAECLTGKCQLWVAVGNGRIYASAITMISDQPKNRACTIVHLGGEELRLWVEKLTAEITKFATFHKCSYIEAVTRRGFSRGFPEFVEDGIIHVKVLNKE